MDNIQKKAIIWSSVIIAVGICLVAYFTFVKGNNWGQSFIEDLRTNQVTPNDILSIEFLSPPIGHEAFTEQEYSILERRSIINDQYEIENFSKILLHEIVEGHVYQNHPGTIYRSYVKINLTNENFYYIYITINMDSKSYFVYINANSLGSTNPNGAKLYRNNNFLGILKKYDFKNIKSSI